MMPPGVADRRAASAVRSGRFIILVILAILTATGIWQWLSRPDQRRNPVQSACEDMVFEGSSFTICRFDPQQHDFRLAATKADGAPLLTFANLAALMGSDAQRIVFAMNAGMYDLKGRPIGLYVENAVEEHALNRRAGGGNFHMMPNGVFWQDIAGMHVAPTDDFADSRPASVKFATQSGPMLVINGALHPRFSADGTSRKLRNGVGVTANGDALFVISNAPVSFGKLARLFRDHLACPNALFLDGFVSSLWDGASGRIDQRVPLGPMIVVTEQATGQTAGPLTAPAAPPSVSVDLR